MRPELLGERDGIQVVPMPIGRLSNVVGCSVSRCESMVGSSSSARCSCYDTACEPSRSAAVAPKPCSFARRTPLVVSLLHGDREPSYTTRRTLDVNGGERTRRILTRRRLRAVRTIHGLRSVHRRLMLSTASDRRGDILPHLFRGGCRPGSPGSTTTRFRRLPPTGSLSRLRSPVHDEHRRPKRTSTRCTEARSTCSAMSPLSHPLHQRGG